MKPLRSFFAALTLLAAALLIMNCGEKTSTGPGGGQQIIGVLGSVIVTADDQQLLSIAGAPVETPILAMVTDTAGTALPGVLVKFTTPDFGSVSVPEDSTDENGQVEVTFYSGGSYGQATITATVTYGAKTVSGSTQIDILSLVGQPHDVTLTLLPDQLFIAPGFEETMQVTVRVMDSLNVGIPGVYVALSTTLGVITYAEVTDNSGTLVTYVNPNEEYGAGVVTASVNTTLPPDTGSITASLPEGPITWPGLEPGSVLSSVPGNSKGIGPESSRQIYDLYTISASDSFWVYPVETNGILLVYSDTDLIYADNGITKANITALLKDAENQVIGNASIIFTSNYGTVNSPVLTDSTGQAKAVFQDIGFPSVPDSARVMAKYSPLNLTDTVYVTIDEARNVDHIVLNAATTTMIANNYDSTEVNATVWFEGNSLAPAGTEVYFIVGGDNIGEFSSPIASANAVGTATVYYRKANTPGIDTLYASVDNVISDPPVVMQLISGPPNKVDVTADPSTLMVNTTLMSTITATVRDTTDNLVGDGVPVLFTTNLGSISPPEAPTIDGIATSYFSPSTNAGTAKIKAQVGLAIDSTLITIMPSTPSQIGLSTQSTTIQVVGTGGDYQTEIYAYVTDASGNLVLNDVMVHFQIQNDGFPFGGVNINNHGYEDSTLTVGGIATRVLNAGINSGPVTIKAWTFDDSQPPIEIWAQSPLVTIVSGPPDVIDVGVDYAEPEPIGGDTWQVEVSALVLDTYGNEVVDSTAVHFYLSGDTLTNVQILGDAFTFNTPPLTGGEPQQGVAFTALNYHSDATFTWVWIAAYCMVGGEAIIDSILYQCPLADGELGMTVIPSSWHYGMLGNPAVMECRAYLTDGYYNPINGATIIFHSTRGNFYWDAFGVAQSYEKITGPGGFVGEPPDPNGYATVYLITDFVEAFPEPSAVEATAQVWSVVNGYFAISSDPFTVTYINGPPPPPE